ncbi:hypothetical protein ZEAMMB73_Zm00001d031262 [Zea mays]|uniref:Uncharacterized protein n=1 Tax=Zea mays TaxID=4577 RepID=A0A1D6KHR3_MAIZE|nr:hypothetical protein ZEAMMB73_Zm00001d036002 [Zea mays]ONM02542.1 hypothetical protein ZEAMMB73_Zm00001d031262 [Zea mays]
MSSPAHISDASSRTGPRRTTRTITPRVRRRCLKEMVQTSLNLSRNPIQMKDGIFRIML